MRHTLPGDLPTDDCTTISLTACLLRTSYPTAAMSGQPPPPLSSLHTSGQRQALGLAISIIG
jgi:hypothetical protein